MSEPEHADVCNGLLPEHVCEVEHASERGAKRLVQCALARAARGRSLEGKPSGFTEGEGSS